MPHSKQDLLTDSMCDAHIITRMRLRSAHRHLAEASSFYPWHFYSPEILEELYTEIASRDEGLKIREGEHALPSISKNGRWREERNFILDLGRSSLESYSMNNKLGQAPSLLEGLNFIISFKKRRYEVTRHLGMHQTFWHNRLKYVQQSDIELNSELAHK